jgi:hypothetical protein
MIAAAELSPVEEPTTNQAAQLLSCHPKAIRQYIDQGALIARDAAPPRSSHRDWRIPITAVIAICWKELHLIGARFIAGPSEG